MNTVEPTEEITKKAIEIFLKEYMFIEKTDTAGDITAIRLDVETAIAELQEIGVFRPIDMFLLNLYIRGFTVSDVAAILTCSRKLVHRELDRIYSEIVKVLGNDYFGTD